MPAACAGRYDDLHTRPVNAIYIYRARCHRIKDGDTFILDVDLGFNVRAHVNVRLRDVNAPERGTPEGKLAMEWLKTFISSADLLVTSYKDKMSFERWICDVRVFRVVGDPEPVDLATAMIEAGHARRVAPK